ncbi:Transcriptional regulator, PadR family [hydrothermal vent metagenome]|uniref:Transcriptional regulator, PadR family n=1 Tax=hydrothermal vent metagenome TaxID=652676 RepID=A0A3B0XX32_9ZZZZ
MSLKFAVLGLLNERPMHGYEIKQVFSTSFAELWHVSPGHLYPLLRKIVEEGLASKKIVAREGRPSAHVYHITPDGRTRFRDWLDECSTEMPLMRYDFMLKLFFYRDKDPQKAAEEIDALQQTQRMFIAHLEEKKRAIVVMADPFQLQIVEGGILMAECGIQWLDRVKNTLHREAS